VSRKRARWTLVSAALAAVLAVTVVLATQRGRSDERDQDTAHRDAIADLKRVFRTARTARDGLRFAERDRAPVAIDDESSAYCGPWEASPPSILEEGESPSPPPRVRTERTVHVAGFWPSPAQRRSWLLRVAPAQIVEGHTIRLGGIARMQAPPVALSVQMAPKRSFSTERGARGWIRIDRFGCPPTDVAFSADAVLVSERGGPPLAVRGEFRAVFAPMP
jgi:hypothetical protein